ARFTFPANRRLWGPLARILLAYVEEPTHRSSSWGIYRNASHHRCRRHRVRLRSLRAPHRLDGSVRGAAPASGDGHALPHRGEALRAVAPAEGRARRARARAGPAAGPPPRSPHLELPQKAV